MWSLEFLSLAEELLGLDVISCDKAIGGFFG